MPGTFPWGLDVATVWASGVPMQTLGVVGEVSWSHRADGGCWDASWAMAGLAKSVAHPLLKRGDPVSITFGGWPVWRGLLDEPGASMESFTARGLSREAERFVSLDADGAPSTEPATAITEAIARGLPWLYSGGAPVGIDSDSAELLSQLLDLTTTAAAQRWGVDAFGVPYFRTDPTTPSLHAFPDTPVMGQADDEYVTHIYGRYVSAVSGTPPVPSEWDIAVAANELDAERWGTSERYVDLTGRGLLSSSVAAELVSGMLAKSGGRLALTERLEVDGLRLLDAGGGHVPLWSVQAGSMVRVHGAIEPGQSATGETFLDFVIGETSYTAGDSWISLAPLGLAPRTLSDVLSSLPIKEDVA